MGATLKLVAAVALVGYVLLSRYYYSVPEVFKPGLCDFGHTKELLDTQCYFSESYWEARAKFRFLAQAAGAQVSAREIVAGDYTTDFAVFPGTEDGLVIHSSGVHGVEGYAGSSVQCMKLHELALLAAKTEGQTPPAKTHAGPTLIFVHAVNPYGMAHFRRFNEHNVDLNRNAIRADEWESILQRDRNVAKYEDFSSLFNPKNAPTLYDAYVDTFAKAIFNIVAHGFVNLKRAIVTGQYHDPSGVYYGGQGLEPSHVALGEFLQPFTKTKGPVTWVDVHTGLGPSGVDTLLVESQAEADDVNKWFAGAPAIDATGPDATGDVGAGYDLTRGFMKDFYADLFASAVGGEAMVLSQEFGTLPGIFVARAMILENQAFQHDPQQQPFWATFTRDAFYVRNPTWKKSVAQRGFTVLNQAIARSSSTERPSRPPLTTTSQAETSSQTKEL